MSAGSFSQIAIYQEKNTKFLALSWLQYVYGENASSFIHLFKHYSREVPVTL